MAQDIDILLAIASMIIILGVAVVIILYMNYKEYRKTKKVDLVAIGSGSIAIVVTLAVAIFFTWDILINTLNNLDPTDIDAAGRAVDGFIFVNFFILVLTFALSYGLLEKVVKK